MLPKKPRSRFAPEPSTRPSSSNPLRSGKHPSFREPPPVEEVDIARALNTLEPKPRTEPPGTGPRRRYSAERETARKPTEWDVEPPKDPRAEPDDDAPPTPRPQVKLAHVPRVVMHEVEILHLPLAPRTGFLLSHIDGKTSVQTIIDIAAMDTKEVLRILDELLLFGVINVK